MPQAGLDPRARWAPRVRRAPVGFKVCGAAPGFLAQPVPWDIAVLVGRGVILARAASVATCWWAQQAVKARRVRWGSLDRQVFLDKSATRGMKDTRDYQGHAETRYKFRKYLSQY